MGTALLKEDQISEITSLLLKGGVVAFPTDTVYGVACVYDNEEAINNLKLAKGRPDSKPLPMMVGDLEQLKSVALVDERTEKIARAWMPGALTIVLKKDVSVPSFTTNDKDTIAIRMPKHEFVLKLLKSVGKPLLVTSANLSGEPSTHSYDEVLKSLGGRIDALVSKDSDGDVASTIIDLTKEDIVVLREGPLSLEQIKEALK